MTPGKKRTLISCACWKYYHEILVLTKDQMWLCLFPRHLRVICDPDESWSYHHCHNEWWQKLDPKIGKVTPRSWWNKWLAGSDTNERVNSPSSHCTLSARTTQSNPGLKNNSQGGGHSANHTPSRELWPYQQKKEFNISAFEKGEKRQKERET